LKAGNKELNLNSLAHKAALWLYNLCWGLAIPVLRFKPGSVEGLDQRVLTRKTSEVDLWIQAASAGESYLTWSLLKYLKPVHSIKVLVTSNTIQGIEVLERAINNITPNDRGVSASVAYFPFDKPTIMEEAVRKIRPKIMVLIESEMWPGLLGTLKKNNCKTIIINGRITKKSLRRYLIWPSFWYSIRPDKILAISHEDAKRFARIFGDEIVETMNNIKFDRISDPETSSPTENLLIQIIHPHSSFIVLGSIRQPEEPEVRKIIIDLRRRQPETIIGLFPRHIHRIDYWKNALDRLQIPWTVRSEIEKYVPNGTVILWDIFGELEMAYSLSKAAFVGGSLAPLGGQNFLEPLSCGVIPVIGPFWDNFAWVGREIIEQGLVKEAVDWKSVSDALVNSSTKPFSRRKVQEAVYKYVKKHQGGTAHACSVINEFLDCPKTTENYL
jgi:3-deoxy-D-manno-octulosonic-acid transferase